MFPKKRLTGEGGFDEGGEGVADVGGGDAFAVEEVLFEGEDTEEAAENAAEGFDAAFSPGPDLRGDQVEDGDGVLMEAGGDAEVEVGGIGEEGEGGAFGAGGVEESVEFPTDTGQVGDDFDDADDGKGGGVDDGADAGGAELGAGAAEEIGVGVEFAEFADDEGGVEVA